MTSTFETITNVGSITPKLNFLYPSRSLIFLEFCNFKKNKKFLQKLIILLKILIKNFSIR
jgi:hypothetical protein